MKDFSSTTILDALHESTSSPQRVTVHVPRGVKAWNPASTSSSFVGPADITYTMYVDGGIDARIDRLEA